jgi:hypothetical protein
LQEHRDYDEEIKERIEWIRYYIVNEVKLSTIEEIDSLDGQVKKAAERDNKTEKKITKILMGKDRIKIEKLWN